VGFEANDGFPIRCHLLHLLKGWVDPMDPQEPLRSAGEH
jgi:hypothetical protein